MINGMTTAKIAVSLPTELVEQAHRAVAEGHAASVSAYVARALEEQAKLDDLATLLMRCWLRREVRSLSLNARPQTGRSAGEPCHPRQGSAHRCSSETSAESSLSSCEP